MSPAPARTSRDAIVAAAREILESDGLDAVSMASVAARVGVRGPSLYKHVRDRSGLIDAIAVQAAAELEAAMAAADPGDGTPAEARLASLATAFRAFARRSPRATAMLFTDLGPGSAAALEAAARAAGPVVAVAAALAGPADALAAARVLTAFTFGFTTMELAGGFRMGGDPEAAFRLGIETLARGMQASVAR
ncbi:MAG: WHG domain-containing protein [Chloroflexota bacterium]